MPRPPFRLLLGLLTLSLLSLAACTTGPLARPAILGASASAGFGCETTGPDGNACLADMEAVYQATVPGWHADPVFLADAAFYTRPRQAQVEQMDAALAKDPSILIAVDYLFWSVYALREPAMNADAVERDRHDVLEQALAQLDRFKGPVIVGDIPDMRASTGRMLSERNVPPPSQLDAFNRRIRDWAASRPADAPAVVIPAAELGRAVEARAPLTTSHETFPPDHAASFLQPDRLHPTTAGLIVLLREGLAGLAARGVIKADSFRTSLAEINARLPAEAQAVAQRREPGLWTLLSVKGKVEDFNDAIKAKDCPKADALFDQVMEKVSRLKRSPHEFADVFVSYTLMKYRWSCDDSVKVIARWRDRLDPEIERPLPDPWPLALWQEFNDTIDQERRSVERMLRLKRENPALPDDYAELLRDAAKAARYTDPAAFLELLPGWRKEIDRQARMAKEIADFWTRYAQSPKWPQEAERNYQSALRFALNDEERKSIAARRAEFDSPRSTIVSARSGTIESIVAIERALLVTGRPQDAANARDRLAQIADADEIASARKAVEKNAAKK